MTNDETGKPEQDSAAPSEETPETWQMPEPVFRTSDGEEYSRSETKIEIEDLHKTEDQSLSSANPKASRMPLVMGVVFGALMFAAVFTFGIWFFLLKDIEPPKILTPDVEKVTPTPVPTAASTETPALPATPTQTPAPTATPTPAPGEAPPIA